MLSSRINSISSKSNARLDFGVTDMQGINRNFPSGRKSRGPSAAGDASSYGSYGGVPAVTTLSPTLHLHPQQQQQRQAGRVSEGSGGSGPGSHSGSLDIDGFELQLSIQTPDSNDKMRWPDSKEVSELAYRSDQSNQKVPTQRSRLSLQGARRQYEPSFLKPVEKTGPTIKAGRRSQLVVEGIVRNSRKGPDQLFDYGRISERDSLEEKPSKGAEMSNNFSLHNILQVA
jgi:hypothetical protein